MRTRERGREASVKATTGSTEPASLAREPSTSPSFATAKSHTTTPSLSGRSATAAGLKSPSPPPKKSKGKGKGKGKEKARQIEETETETPPRPSLHDRERSLSTTASESTTVGMSSTVASDDRERSLSRSPSEETTVGISSTIDKGVQCPPPEALVPDEPPLPAPLRAVLDSAMEELTDLTSDRRKQVLAVLIDDVLFAEDTVDDLLAQMAADADEPIVVPVVVPVVAPVVAPVAGRSGGSAETSFLADPVVVGIVARRPGFSETPVLAHDAVANPHALLQPLVDAYALFRPHASASDHVRFAEETVMHLARPTAADDDAPVVAGSSGPSAETAALAGALARAQALETAWSRRNTLSMLHCVSAHLLNEDLGCPTWARVFKDLHAFWRRIQYNYVTSMFKHIDVWQEDLPRTLAYAYMWSAPAMIVRVEGALRGAGVHALRMEVRLAVDAVVKVVREIGTLVPPAPPSAVAPNDPDHH